MPTSGPLYAALNFSLVKKKKNQTIQGVFTSGNGVPRGLNLI